LSFSFSTPTIASASSSHTHSSRRNAQPRQLRSSSVSAAPSFPFPFSIFAGEGSTAQAYLECIIVGGGDEILAVFLCLGVAGGDSSPPLPAARLFLVLVPPLGVSLLRVRVHRVWRRLRRGGGSCWQGWGLSHHPIRQVGNRTQQGCVVLLEPCRQAQCLVFQPLCYTKSGAGGPARRLSGLQTRSRAALGFLKSRPEQVYVPANRPAAPLRTLERLQNLNESKRWSLSRRYGKSSSLGSPLRITGFGRHGANNPLECFQRVALRFRWVGWVGERY